MKTSRSSNMELLRICAMLMIVAYHIYTHCISCQLTDLQSMQDRGNGWFCTPDFSKRLCILALVAPWGQIGNAIFLIISGYFMASAFCTLWRSQMRFRAVALRSITAARF